MSRGRRGTLEEWSLLRNVELASQHGPLVLHVDAPSPGSMVKIEGHFRFIGGRPKQAIWITASGPGDLNDSFWPRGERGDGFSLGPVPGGKYHLIFDSPEIETKEIDVDTATIKDLSVEIHVRGAIVLRGSVSLPATRAPSPPASFSSAPSD